jgi:hypothetical protein
MKLLVWFKTIQYVDMAMMAKEHDDVPFSFMSGFQLPGQTSGSCKLTLS